MKIQAYQDYRNVGCVISLPSWSWMVVVVVTEKYRSVLVRALNYLVMRASQQGSLHNENYPSCNGRLIFGSQHCGHAVANRRFVTHKKN